jgi:hypothetical protein
MKHLALLVLVPALMAACQSKPDTTGKRTDGFPAPGKDVVAQVAVTTLRDSGYIPDPEASSIENGVVVSRWSMSLQPFSGMGFREQATVRIHDVPGRPDYYVVETNVLRQQNDNMVQPSNPVVAEWTSGERNTDMEQLITGRIQAAFLPADVSTEFRQRYGMQPRPETRIEAPVLLGDPQPKKPASR